MAALVIIDAVMAQNARMASAALLAPLTHLPPTMVLPGKKGKKEEGVKVQDNTVGDE